MGSAVAWSAAFSTFTQHAIDQRSREVGHSVVAERERLRVVVAAHTTAAAGSDVEVGRERSWVVVVAHATTGGECSGVEPEPEPEVEVEAEPEAEAAAPA
eukprot:COSAG04_NODE_1371_length_7040_cov_8.745714_3_plen_100_part_00